MRFSSGLHATVIVRSVFVSIAHYIYLTPSVVSFYCLSLIISLSLFYSTENKIFYNNWLSGMLNTKKNRIMWWLSELLSFFRISYIWKVRANTPLRVMNTRVMSHQSVHPFAGFSSRRAARRPLARKEGRSGAPPLHNPNCSHLMALVRDEVFLGTDSHVTKPLSTGILSHVVRNILVDIRWYSNPHHQASSPSCMNE